MKREVVLPILLGVLALGAGASGLAAFQQAQGEFPHERHERVFPLCSGCHAAIENSTDRDAWYPQPTLCAACHNGTIQDSVVWRGPTREASNLTFVHVEHDQRLSVAGESTTCASCHQDPAEEGPMSVVPAVAESCLDCHAHEAPEHLAAGRDCTSCHLPLAQAAGLSPARIAALERPASHLRPDFLVTHQPLSDLEGTSCATCHARESCERCHFNGSSIPAVQSLSSDARVAQLVAGDDPEYPEPVSHDSPSWQWLHGGAAMESGANCANCHTQPNCESCHIQATATISALPILAAEDARGVRISERASQVHPIGFSTAHGAPATALESTCSTCHTESTCTACHEGASSPGFHIGNFLQAHSAEAYGNEVECATCHNTEVFCRSCHSDVGLAATGRTGAAFHDARPLWLLGHGLAARQGLESCTTCHSQTYCLQCHSSVGGWRVSPHGPDFDPVRAQDSQSKSTCAFCHQTGIPPS